MIKNVVNIAIMKSQWCFKIRKNVPLIGVSPRRNYFLWVVCRCGDVENYGSVFIYGHQIVVVGDKTVLILAVFE